MNFQNHGAKIHDEKVALISERRHQWDKVIDIKQNEHENEDYVWILYDIDDKSIFSKQSIDDLSQNENFYLQLNFQCYAFYFISKTQVVIDCQDSISNIIVLFDIKNKIQQSYYDSYYKMVRLRRLLKVSNSNSLILIQQDQFLLICLRQNKYQICNQQTFENNAHAIHVYECQITLISETKLISLRLLLLICIRQLTYLLEILITANWNPIIDYCIIFAMLLTSINILILDYSLVICTDICFKHELVRQSQQIQVFLNYFTIQTNNSIYVFFIKNGNYSKYNTSIIMISFSRTNYCTKFYQQIRRNQVLWINLEPLYQDQKLEIIIYHRHYKSKIDEQSQDYIILYEQFKCKRYFNIPVSQNTFVEIGGTLNITFDVEDQYKDIIKIQQSYFINVNHQNVLYYFFCADQMNDYILIINKKYEILQIDIPKIISMKMSQTKLTNLKILLL